MEFLQDKGIKISNDPNAKLSDEQYNLVAKEYSKDSEAKKEAKRVDLKTSRQKKETVTIDNINSAPEEKKEPDFISGQSEQAENRGKKGEKGRAQTGSTTQTGSGATAQKGSETGTTEANAQADSQGGSSRKTRETCHATGSGHGHGHSIQIADTDNQGGKGGGDH